MISRIYSYFERNPRLHVLFVFEGMNFFSEDLSGIEWPEDYVYHIFDGAWFNTKYNIENTWADKKVVLLFKEIGFPHSEEEQKRFPLMDMLRANMEYKDDDYASFIQQYNLPEKFTTFVKRHIGELRSQKITDILAGYINRDSFSEDLVNRAIISNYLGDKKLLDWDAIIVKMILLGRESEAKKRLDFYTKLEKNLDANKAMNDKLSRVFGRSYNPNSATKIEDIAMSLKYNALTQLLAADPTDSYKALKVIDRAALSSLNKIYELGTEDRTFSTKFAEAMAELAAPINEEQIIRLYGTEAQYFYYTEALCWPILGKLLSETLLESPEKTTEEIRHIMLKLPMDSDIMIAARLISNMSMFYEKMRTVGSLKLNKPTDYVNLYTTDLYKLDVLYRRTLEAYHALVTKNIPIIEPIEQQKHQLDIDYAKFTNLLNLEWINCVGDCGGSFDSIALPKQQDFYADEYANTGGTTKLAVIISDALRYEVAAELMESLSKEKHVAKLSAAKGVLPTETKYAKRVMFPHLSLTLDGTVTKNDGIDLNTLDSRSAILDKYRQGATCVRYVDIMNDTQANNRELFKRPLVYILHDTIDDAGHNQNPFDVIHACRRSIEQLTDLVQKLHATWNVANVIVTSDHGFLYNDMRFEEKDMISVKEELVVSKCDSPSDAFIEKKTRYYLTESNAEIIGVQKFNMQEVSGITTNQPIYVAVPKGTNRFAAQGGYNFAHGGASLQEMIIPLIHSVQRRVAKTQKVGLTVMNPDLAVVSSRLKFRIMQKEAIDMMLQERKIVCALFDGDRQVSTEQTLLLNSTDSIDAQNRIYEIVLLLNQPTSAGMLQLRIYDSDDAARLNPIVKENVKNNTLIEQDF